MKTRAISEFKAHALKVINEVAQSQETIVITERGKPLAQVTPHRKSEIKPAPGKLVDAFVFEKDIITPLGGDVWEASQRNTCSIHMPGFGRTCVPKIYREKS